MCGAIEVHDAVVRCEQSSGCSVFSSVLVPGLILGFCAKHAVPISSLEAQIAASLYKRVKQPRGREAELVIAACALACEASIWTLNPKDFNDVPGLTLWKPPPLPNSEREN